MVDSTKSPKIQPSDLQTPTLKTGLVTTGRGVSKPCSPLREQLLIGPLQGAGNMAANTDPVETRARQDVEP